jgi:hypothetical protein
VQPGGGLAADGMFLLTSGHVEELRETLHAGLPVLFAALVISVVLVALAVVPPSAFPGSPLAELVSTRRRQFALAGGAISVSAGLVLAIIFWTL